MDRRDDREVLRKSGFAENEVISLSKLRAVYTERKKHQAAIHHRRLEFARWLVVQGKISDQIA